MLQEVVSIGMLRLVAATGIIAMQAVLLAVALHRINAKPAEVMVQVEPTLSVLPVNVPVETDGTGTMPSKAATAATGLASNVQDLTSGNAVPAKVDSTRRLTAVSAGALTTEIILM